MKELVCGEFLFILSIELEMQNTSLTHRCYTLLPNTSNNSVKNRINKLNKKE